MPDAPEPPASANDGAACANCATPLAGAYCHACGQKRLGPGDRSLAHLVGEAFHKLTDVDGTLLRSLRALLLQPGVLARAWMDDRRARYTSPVSLFLLANVLYFFAPAMSDFNLPFVDQVPGAVAAQLVDPAAPDHDARVARAQGRGGQLHSRWTGPLVARKLAAHRAADPAYTMRDLATAYDAQAGVVGKVLIVAHVPVMALALALVFWRRRHWAADHLVVALLVFAWLLLYAQVVVAPVNWLGTHLPASLPPWVGGAVALALTGIVFVYALLTCRVAYRVGWAHATLGLVAVLAGLFVANLWLYRALQFVVTLALV